MCNIARFVLSIHYCIYCQSLMSSLAGVRPNLLKGNMELQYLTLINYTRNVNVVNLSIENQ